MNSLEESLNFFQKGGDERDSGKEGASSKDQIKFQKNKKEVNKMKILKSIAIVVVVGVITMVTGAARAEQPVKKAEDMIVGSVSIPWGLDEEEQILWVNPVMEGDLYWVYGDYVEFNPGLEDFRRGYVENPAASVLGAAATCNWVLNMETLEGGTLENIYYCVDGGEWKPVPSPGQPGEFIKKGVPTLGEETTIGFKVLLNFEDANGGCKYREFLYTLYADSPILPIEPPITTLPTLPGIEPPITTQPTLPPNVAVAP
jgi:hypothetical protein